MLLNSFTTMWLSVDQERQFLDKQAVDMENAVKRLSEQHREKVALYEKQYLQQKHQLKRGAALHISWVYLNVTLH